MPDEHVNPFSPAAHQATPARDKKADKPAADEPRPLTQAGAQQSMVRSLVLLTIVEGLLLGALTLGFVLQIIPLMAFVVAAMGLGLITAFWVVMMVASARRVR